MRTAIFHMLLIIIVNCCIFTYSPLNVYTLCIFPEKFGTFILCLKWMTLNFKNKPLPVCSAVVNGITGYSGWQQWSWLLKIMSATCLWWHWNVPYGGVVTQSTSLICQSVRQTPNEVTVTSCYLSLNVSCIPECGTATFFMVTVRKMIVMTSVRRENKSFWIASSRNICQAKVQGRTLQLVCWANRKLVWFVYITPFHYVLF